MADSQRNSEFVTQKPPDSKQRVPSDSEADGNSKRSENGKDRKPIQSKIDVDKQGLELSERGTESVQCETDMEKKSRRTESGTERRSKRSENESGTERKSEPSEIRSRLTESSFESFRKPSAANKKEKASSNSEKRKSKQIRNSKKKNTRTGIKIADVIRPAGKTFDDEDLEVQLKDWLQSDSDTSIRVFEKEEDDTLAYFEKLAE
jgi:hypothetical protein